MSTNPRVEMEKVVKRNTMLLAKVASLEAELAELRRNAVSAGMVRVAFDSIVTRGTSLLDWPVCLYDQRANWGNVPQTTEDVEVGYFQLHAFTSRGAIIYQPPTSRGGIVMPTNPSQVLIAIRGAP